MSEPNWSAIKIIGNSKTQEYACISCGLVNGPCYKISKREPKSCLDKEKKKSVEDEIVTKIAV